jgi:hypothetical protein
VKFVGWDWASATHDVTVIDQTGQIVDRWACDHTEQGLPAALERLGRQGQPAELPVIIERTSGLVIDRLLDARHPVVPVHPTAFHAARPCASSPRPGRSTRSSRFCPQSQMSGGRSIMAW